MDDVNNMNEPTEMLEQALGSMRRREFLTKAAAAGAVAWATPVVLSRPAFGVEGGEAGTPRCMPKVTVCCTRYFCGQGDKYFPGIAITVSECPCSPGTCASACVLITNVTPGYVAYGPGTNCFPLGPNQGGVDVIFSTNPPTWMCLTSSTSTIFFGPPRSGGGAIPDFESGPGDEVCFDMAVWASCPDTTPPVTPLYTCETHRYCLRLIDGNTPECTCDNPAGPAASLCGGLGFSPCPTCGPQSGCEAEPDCPESVGVQRPPEPNVDPEPIQSEPIACPSP